MLCVNCFAAQTADLNAIIRPKAVFKCVYFVQCILIDSIKVDTYGRRGRYWPAHGRKIQSEKMASFQRTGVEALNSVAVIANLFR